MPLKCGSASTDYHWYQVHEIDRALSTMEKYGIPTEAEAYQTLYRQRGALLAQVGKLHPKPVVELWPTVWLSPVMVKVWLDTESGWMAEAREKPGTPPIYKRVSDEVAMAILKGEVTPELEKELLTPDEYLGE